jgi:hypothetical protein
MAPEPDLRGREGRPRPWTGAASVSGQRFHRAAQRDVRRAGSCRRSPGRSCPIFLAPPLAADQRRLGDVLAGNSGTLSGPTPPRATTVSAGWTRPPPRPARRHRSGHPCAHDIRCHLEQRMDKADGLVHCRPRCRFEGRRHLGRDSPVMRGLERVVRRPPDLGRQVVAGSPSVPPLAGTGSPWPTETILGLKPCWIAWFQKVVKSGGITTPVMISHLPALKALIWAVKSSVRF